NAWAADPARRRPSRAAAVRRRRVRGADVHLPLALRRGSAGDPLRAGARRSSRRHDRDARVRPPARCVAAALGTLGPDRTAGSRTADFAGLARGGGLPRPEHPGFLERTRPGRAVPRSRDRRRTRAAAQPRRRRCRLGPSRMNAGTRPAFYALSSGGWRDYFTLLHPPYTLWHLSYVAVGAGLASPFSWTRWAAAFVSFALGMGIGAHALDELRGRPLHTRIPDRTLWALATVSIAAATGVGVY